MINLPGAKLHDAVRHLAPVARSSLNTTDRRLRIRCVDHETVEFTAIGRLLTARTFACFTGEGFDEAAVIDADLLHKLSSRLKKSPVSFELKTTNELELRSENITTTFPRGEGPCVVDGADDEDVVFTMPAPFFAEVMKQALPYASNDSHRPALCGVHVDQVEGETHVTATNGATLFNRRFENRWWSGRLDHGVILPDVALKLALKLIGAKNDAGIAVSLGERTIKIIQVGVFEIVADRIDASFPDFRQCIPGRSVQTRTATFDASVMLGALDAALPFVGKSEAVKLVYNGSVQVQVESDAGQFDCDVQGEYDGDTVARLTFNRRYLAGMCSTLGRGCGAVEQLVGGAVEPQVFCACDDRRTRVIVMPMRL